jgi:hypothetical protein
MYSIAKNHLNQPKELLALGKYWICELLFGAFGARTFT